MKAFTWIGAGVLSKIIVNSVPAGVIVFLAWLMLIYAIMGIIDAD